MDYKDSTKRSWQLSAAVLTVTILMTLGSHYCFDAPSVMESQMTKEFHLNAKEYHALFLMNSWGHMVMGLLSGVMIDKFGTALMAVLFGVFFVIGQSIFALGATLSMYWMMLVGRTVYSLGSGPIQIVQSAICAEWFRHKGLGLSFGMVLTIGHIGSVLNFLITPVLSQRIGVAKTLWFADALAVFSMFCCFTFYLIDRKYKVIGDTKIKVRRIAWKKLAHIGIGPWLIFVMSAAYYSVIFPLNSLSSKYMQVAYGYKLDEASWIAGTIYYAPFLLGPPFGVLVDRIGWRVRLGAIGFVLMIPALGLIGFMHFNPIPFFAVLGLTYAFVPAILWGSLPFLVEPDMVGTVMGMNAFCQMLGVGANQITIGALRDSYGYKAVFADLDIISLIGLVFALLLYYTKGHVLNSATLPVKFPPPELGENESLLRSTGVQ